MKKFGELLSAIAITFLIACQGSDLQDPVSLRNTQAPTANAGPGGMRMQAYYDDVLFTVNMFQLPDDAAHKILDQNKSLNEIYVYCDLDEECDLIPVIDAIQGDGFNPLWQQVDIVFPEGVDPVQFTSDTDIDEAVDNGTITLNYTDEVYRCSVLQHNSH